MTYTLKERDDLCNVAKSNFKIFADKTIFDFKLFLTKLEDKHKRAKAQSKYESFEGSMQRYITENYPALNNKPYGTYTNCLNTYIFANLSCEVASIEKELEEVYQLFLLEFFPPTIP